MANCLRLTVLTLLLFAGLQADAMGRDAWYLLQRIFRYTSVFDTCRQDTTTTYAYQKYILQTRRRNVILLSVPTMYTIAHGGDREYIGEAYDRVSAHGLQGISATRILERSTFPRGRRAMPTMLKYLTPRLYDKVLIDRHILSPFHRSNRNYYRYRLDSVVRDTAYLHFRPRVNNTQLVSGQARVMIWSGHILDVNLRGEYDMVQFHIFLNMGRDGIQTLIPKDCRLDATFRFLGNNIHMDYRARYGMPDTLSGRIVDCGDSAAIARIRPFPLTPHEQALFARKYAEADSIAADTAATQKRGKTAARWMWDNIGERLLTRVKSNFGNHDQGYFRISPLLNPLYLGYSGRRGLTYKIDIRGNYYFGSNSLIETRLKAGYSFKQRQFYFNIPVTYYFDRRHTGFLRAEVGNGNHITNSTVAEAIKSEHRDSVDWSRMNLSYFRDTFAKLTVSYDPLSWLTVEAALVTHRRTAIDKAAYIEAGRPTHYTSTAPMLELRFRPWGNNGPVIAADYERSIRGFMGANIAYERYEFDAQYNLHLSPLSSVQARTGTGFYTHRGKDWFFLDYTNFHDSNLPGGWNDEWANNFELLNSNWYNASDYYIRTNVTYESPLLALSWIPLAGRFIEKERIYVNVLHVRKLHPYIEYGYGFATRLFSIGLFVGQSNGKFEGFGCKFGFELFRQW